MKYLLLITMVFFMNCSNGQTTKAEQFIKSKESCCGGNCGGVDYKIWQDSLTLYVVTGKAIPYSIKELTDGESMRMFFFIKNDQKKKTLTIKLKDANDRRAFQGFLCEVLGSM